MTYISKQQLLANSASFAGSFTEVNGELAYVVPSDMTGTVTIQAQLRYTSGNPLTDSTGTEVPPADASTITID